MNIRGHPRVLLLGLLVFVSSGCTKTFIIDPVISSDLSYPPVITQAPTTLGIADQRAALDKPLNAGRLNVVLKGMEDEIAYLGENLTRIFKEQGWQVAYQTNGPADMTLEVRKFRIRNHRASGFSPFVTSTVFSADLKSGNDTYRISSYFKNGKVPMWAFSEVQRPCYQIPVELAVKEIAAKINAHTLKRVTPVDVVKRMAVQASSAQGGSGMEEYIKVLELGYTNNPAAIAPLVRLTEHADSMIRAAAISAIGILQAKEQFPLLKKLYETNDGTVKYMALKSIGDLDTQDSKEFLSAVKQSNDYHDKWIKEVADLYL